MVAILSVYATALAYSKKPMSRNSQIGRRELLMLACAAPTFAQSKAEDGFRSLFDGVSLKGWKRSARELKRPSLGIWTVEDGIISGGQDPPGSGIGSYLVSEETFSDFELKIEARPDWPADT